VETDKACSKIAKIFIRIRLNFAPQKKHHLTLIAKTKKNVAILIRIALSIAPFWPLCKHDDTHIVAVITNNASRIKIVAQNSGTKQSPEQVQQVIKVNIFIHDYILHQRFM
jgi:hypothetical protein